ncbi:MAG: ExbD/TolR family protein [bacterium]
MLNKGGIIIRLIDVAMIILFGFIAISDIKVRAQIKLPSDRQEQVTQEEKEPVLIVVKIDLEQGFVIAQNEVALLTTRDGRELETTLANLSGHHRLNGQEMVVLIEPDEDSMIQHTVDVLDICERNKIPFNISYASMQF